MIAKEQRLLCALFVVRNLRMKSIFSGGAQGGRCLVVRSKPQTTWIARRGRRAPQEVASFWKTLSQSHGRTWDRVHEHIRSAATPCQTASFRMRDSEGKPGAMIPSWPGLMEHVSVRTRGSEERAVEYSLVSTMTDIAPSPCLGVSRRTIVRSCWLLSLRCKFMMGISRSDRTVCM